MLKVRKAVILAAGLGTRMLPATKAVPKELLPIVDRPLVQYAVQEAVDAGIEHIIFVIAEGKEAIAEHFGRGGRVEQWAAGRGDSELLATVQSPADLARFDYVHQDQSLGIAHAVACARQFVEGEPFALMFPDDIIFAETSCVAQLVNAYTHGGSLIAVQTVSDSEVEQYGIVDTTDSNNPAQIRSLIEKPKLSEAPSRLGIVGRYILGPTIFQHIDGLERGAKGELQITDALARQIEAGEPVSAFSYEGKRFDTGRPIGYLAAGIAAGLARPDLEAGIRSELLKLLSEDTE